MAIWADATFVWNPGDAITASFDEISLTSASGLTEGDFVSSPHPGRHYTAGEGSRFAVTPLAGNANVSSFTMMLYATRDEATDSLLAFMGNPAVADRYAHFRHVLAGGTNPEVVGGLRAGGTSEGGTNWPAGKWESVTPPTVAVPHCYILRVIQVGQSQVLCQLFVDGKLWDARMQTAANAVAVSRLTLGRMDDSTPEDGTGTIFGSAVWDRALTDAELRAVNSDPLSYPTDPADPDDWYDGQDQWEGAFFVYNPSNANLNARNQVYGWNVEMPFDVRPATVTVAGVPGRTYGVREGIPWLPQEIYGTRKEWTMMLVTRINASTDQIFYSIALNSDSDRWVSFQNSTDVSWWVGIRTNGAGTPGGAGWPQALQALPDSDLHVLVATFEEAAGTVTVTLWVDGVEVDSDAQAIAEEYWNAARVGGLEDSSPQNANSFDIFAGVMWGRVLTDTEIELVSLNPYGYNGGVNPNLPAASDFTGGDGDPWPPEDWNTSPGAGGGTTVIDTNRGEAAGSAGNANSGGRGKGTQGKVPNQELEFDFQLCEVGEPCRGAVWLQTSDDWAGLDHPTEGYGVYLPSDSDTASLVLAFGGVVSTLDTGVWPRDTGLKHGKMRRQNKKIRFKIWDDGDPEPTDWLLSADDETITPDAAGAFQVAYTCPTAPSVDACALFDNIDVDENDTPIPDDNGDGGCCRGFDCLTRDPLVHWCLP